MCSIIGVGERLHKVLGLIDLGTLDSGDRNLPFGLLVIEFEQYWFHNRVMLPKDADRMRNEPHRDKTNKMNVCPVKTQISLGIRPV